MAGVSYESLLKSIRDAPVASARPDDPSLQPAPPQGQTFEEMFGTHATTQGDGDAVASEPAPPLFDLRHARLASGWGGVAGLVVGAFVGAKGGMGWLVIGAATGTVLGSIVGIAVLSLFAGAVQRLGALWAMILAAIAVGIGAAVMGR